MVESLTVTEFARRAGVHRKTVIRWAQSGRVRARRTRGGHWRIDARDLERSWLTTREYAAAAGVCYRTAVRRCESGRIRAERTPGSWRIPASELERAVLGEK